MEQVARSALRFILAELLVLVAGLYLFASPPLIAILLVFGAGAIGALELIAARWHLKIDPQSPGLSAITLVWVVAATTAGAWYAVHQPFETHLWRTGQFGEPPTNRHLTISRLSPQSLLLEYRVETTPIGPFFVIAKLTHEPVEYFGWISFSGELEPDRDAIGLNKLNVGPTRTEEHSFSSTSESRGLAPGTSAYLYFAFENLGAVSDCALGSLSDPSDKEDIFCKRGGVVIEVLESDEVSRRITIP